MLCWCAEASFKVAGSCRVQDKILLFQCSWEPAGADAAVEARNKRVALAAVSNLASLIKQWFCSHLEGQCKRCQDQGQGYQQLGAS